MAGLLAAGFPITVLLVVIVAATASSSVAAAGDRALVTQASALAGDVDRFVFERRRDLEQVSAALGGAADVRDVELLRRFQGQSTAFRSIEVLDRAGQVLAAAGPAFGPGPNRWFADALAGASVTSPRYRVADGTQWVSAQPLRNGTSTGTITGIVAGDIEPSGLDAIVAGAAPRRGRIAVIDNDRRTVVSSGSPSLRIPGVTVAASLAGAPGPVRRAGTVAGVAPVRSTGWGVVVIAPGRVAQREAGDIRRVAAIALAAGLAIFVAFAALFARGEEWRLRVLFERRLAEARDAGEGG